MCVKDVATSYLLLCVVANIKQQAHHALHRYQTKFVQETTGACKACTSKAVFGTVAQ